MAAKHDRLREAWRKYNNDDFDGLLREPVFSVGRRERLVDGALTYTRRGGSVKLMVKGEVFRDNTEFLATLLHEMIHQWELEVLKIDPQDADHGTAFKEKAAALTEKYGVPVL